MASKYNIIYTSQFESDLDNIADYFCNTLMNPSAYINLVSKIEFKEQMLRTYPNSCSDFESNLSLKKKYKKFHIGNYTIFFYVDEEEKIVYVRRILYSGMDLKNMIF